MASGRAKQGQVEMVFRTRGGKRRGAGRKPKGKRSSERHKARPEHDPRHPVHVTIRVVADVSSLRRRDMYSQLREATIVTARREDFRIVHMSIQSNHIHLIVEAEHKEALSKGMQGFSISAAKRVNATISERTGIRRTGRVVADRFHARPLTSPRAVRHALGYVRVNRSIYGAAACSESRATLGVPVSPSGGENEGGARWQPGPLMYSRWMAAVRAYCRRS